MEFEFAQRQRFHQYIHLKNKTKPNKTHMVKSPYQKHWYGNFVGFVYLCVCVWVHVVIYSGLVFCTSFELVHYQVN